MDDLFLLLLCLGIPVAIIGAISYAVKSAKKEEAEAQIEIQNLINTIPQESHAAFFVRYNSESKNPTTAIILALLFGGLGFHKFYLKQTGVGILYLFFFWTSIPAFVAFFEAFTISKLVHRMNKQVALETAAMFRTRNPQPIEPAPPPTPAPAPQPAYTPPAAGASGIPMMPSLPSKCPNCTAPLSMENINWTGPMSVACPSCGNGVEVSWKKIGP